MMVVTDIQGGAAECKFEELGIDNKIAREFWYKYSDTLDKKIKRNLKKIFGKKQVKKHEFTKKIIYNVYNSRFNLYEHRFLFGDLHTT